jgi:hypothetical protein
MGDREQHEGHWRSITGSTAVVFTLVALFGALWGAAPAHAGTQVINFEDLADGTTVTNQYAASAAVTFDQTDAYLPVVREVGAQAHAGTHVADFSTCQGPGCGEGFAPPAARGDLSTSATSVSMYVGEMTNQFPRAMPVQLTAYDAAGTVLDQSPQVMVNSGDGINTHLEVASAKPISYFVVEDPNGGDFSLAMDDVTIVTPDAPQPPDISLTQGNSVLDAIQGASVSDPLTINRINGSTGDVTMSVSGLPTGMTGTFSPNPVPATSSSTTLTVTAAQTAAASVPYSAVTITATPSAGAGSAPRSVTAQARISENCAKTVTFTYIDLRDDGCLLKQANNTYQAVNTTVRVDGLVLSPLDGDHVLTIDPTGQTIKSDLGATYSVAVQGSPDTPFYYGPISWSLGDYTGPIPLSQLDPSFGKLKSIEGIDISGQPLFQGIPLTGISVSFTPSAKAIVMPTLTLDQFPFNYFGSTTVSTSFLTDNDHGASFSSLEIKVPDLNVLALELKNVDLKYSNTNTWSGSADVVLDFADKLTVGGGFGIKNGKLDFLKADVGNINTPVGEGVYLQGIAFEIDLNPTTLKGGITLSAGPAVAGRTALSFTGSVTAVLADPWVIEVDGSAKVADKYDLASAFLRYTSTGLFEFGGQVGWNFDVLSLKGNVNGWVAGAHNFDIEGGVSGCVSLFITSACADAKVLISNLGLAGCVEVFGEGVGVGSHWGDDFDAFTGCDLSKWRPTEPTTTTASVATAARQLTVAPGQSTVAWSIDGSGGRAPAVTVLGPGHARVSVSDVFPFVHNSRFYAAETSNGRTYVIVNHPKAGKWTITADGNVPITRIRQAVGLPKPHVSAKVTGKGRSRVLSWKLRKIPGQVVTFAEIGSNVRSVIGATSKANGSVHFTPADGPAGVRKIEALVQQDNRPRTTLTVATYRAPAAPRPGKASKIKLTRKGTTLTVRWTASPAGFRTAVYAKFSDGRRLVTIASAKRHSVSFVDVAATTTAKITLTGLTAGNAKGPAAHATLNLAPKHKKKTHKPAAPKKP